jgi:ABC-type nitrate/sulfonate/bicarbonate transport system permease component
VTRFNYRPLVVIAVLVLGWQLALGGGHVVSDTLAPPGPVVLALLGMLTDGSVLRASGATLSAALLGLALGAGLGTGIGLVCGMVRPVATALRGPVEVLRPLPAIALVPLMTIIFGLGLEMEVYVVAFAVIWPGIILTQHAVQNIERGFLEVADVLQLGPIARIRKVILPAILPRLVVMLRFTAAIALLMAVTVELVSNPWGLGHDMMVASQDLAPARMIAFLIVITAIGWCLNSALLTVERYLLPGAARRAPPGGA